MQMKKVFALMLAFCLIVGLTACGQDNDTGNTTEEGVTESGSTDGDINLFTYVSYTDPMVFWDPGESWALEIIVMQNLYETLVRIDVENDAIIPVLATDWSTSEDGLEWRFTLREGVQFHSGKELTPEIAAASLKRTIDNEKGAYEIFDGVADVTADGNEVVFTLERPLPMLQIVSASYGAYIYDPSYDSEWYYEANADGTGPYKLMSYQKDSEVILEKFDDYWGGWEKEGHFDAVVVKAISESSISRQLIVNGEADIVQQLAVEDLEAIKDEPGITISNVVSFQQLSTFLNTAKAPLDNKLVRQALSYLTPYDDIISHVKMGNAVQARGVVPPTLWGHGENLHQYTHDVEKAKELLAEAGYADGLSLLYTYTSGDVSMQRVGELLKDAFAEANVDLELRGMTIDARYNLAKAQNPEDRQDIIVMYWWPDNYDPATYLHSQFHSEEEIGYNYGYYKNEEVDRLIDEAMYVSGLSIEEATEKYIQAQEIIIDEAPAIFIYCENYVRPYRSDIKGYTDNPLYPNVVFFHEVTR